MIDEATLNELINWSVRAKDAADSLRDAIKIQAIKHDLDPTALGQFVRAKRDDKLEELARKIETIEQLQLAFDDDFGHRTRDLTGSPAGARAEH